MFTKFYENIKNFIIENYLVLLFYLVLIAVFTYPLPYYIYTGGGIMNVDSKIKMEDKKKVDGSFNLCYVEELQATLPTYLLSYIIPDWELVSAKDVSFDEDETSEEIMIRDKIYLDTANRNAVLTAFSNAEKEYKILDNRQIVIYVFKEAKTDLKIGDIIYEINGVSINDKDDISDYTKNLNVGDKITVKVKNKDKYYNRYAYIIEEDGKKMVGVSIEEMISYETNPDVEFNFSNTESGPSGGLIVSLALYNYLVDEDITNGLKISGTGTISEDGTIGSIGGVKYKLAGAVKKKSDIFFVPSGENYEEAIKLKKEKKYNIDIVGVSNFKDAIDYLENKKR